MDLRLLGPVEVRLEDRLIELGPRKQRAVLAMLALQAGQTVSADRLAEGLWGDEPPSSAPKMVQLYVSHLRRLLEGEDARIVTRGRGYELQLSNGDVDTARFERLLDESHPREALALWRGEPLADLADEPFAAAEIRRLDELRLRAVEMAVDADLEAGRHAEVIGELDALVTEHSLRERLHGQRMLALYRSGRQAEALEAYRPGARRSRGADRRRTRRRAAAPAGRDSRAGPGARPPGAAGAGRAERCTAQAYPAAARHRCLPCRRRPRRVRRDPRRRA